MESNNIIFKIKNNKKLRNIFIIILSILIVLLLIFNFNDKDNETTKTIAEGYIDSLEQRLTNVLSKIDGAGDVSVIIKAESGMETVLAKETIIKETSSGKEITETPILVNGKTVTLKELYPKITGVLIVTEGAKKISLMHKIQQATTSLLGVDINCIEILSAN